MTWFLKNKARQREELLSAHVDGRLTPKERAEVQRMLDASPEWRRDLERLQATIASLREMPRLQASRSFTLTRDMLSAPVQKEPLRALRLAMSFATGTAALLLAVSLAGGAGFFGRSQPLAAPQQGGLSREASRDNELSTSKQATAPAAQGAATEGGASQDSFMTPAPSLAGPAGAGPSDAPAPPQGFAAEDTPVPQGTPEPYGATEPGAGESTAAVQPDEQTVQETKAFPPVGDDRGSWWTLASIVLGSLTVFLGAMTLWVYRTRPRCCA